MPFLLSMSYASTSGILSGMCLIFAKSGVELLLISINGNNQFWKWQAWMLILGLVAFALLQLWYLHKALKLADPTIVCPREFYVRLILSRRPKRFTCSGFLLLQHLFHRKRPRLF